MVDQTSTIPKGWKITTLGAVAEKIVDNRGKTPPITTSGFELLEVNTISESQRTPDYSRVTKYINEDTFKHWFRTGVILENDILIPTVGTIGNVSFSKVSRGAIAQNLIAVRTDAKKSEPLFVYYFLKNPSSKNKLLNLDIGGVQPSIKVPHLLAVEIETPPLPEQRAIAAVLSSLDDKIELLREQNKTLEATAQAIFKEWFVDFNFPGATGKMIDSELGQIPAGWTVGTVNDVITRHTITYRCDADDLSKIGKTPIIDQGSNGLYGYTEREPDFEASTENPVIIFTNHTCNMWFINYPFCAIQNVIPFRGNAEYSSFFVYYMTLGRVTFIEYKGHWPDFEQKEYAIPTPNLANIFAEIVKPLQHKIWNNNSQIQNLSTLRDTLLPKLMKGEVRVAGFND